MSQIGSTAAGGGGGAVNSVTGGTGINTTGTAADPVVNLDVPVIISHGGTNAITMATTYGVNYFDGTSIVTTAVGNAGEVLTSGGIGVAPTFQASGSTIDITGDSGGALTGTAFTFTGGTTGITFAGAGTTETLTGTLVVANGGTGATTLTDHGVLIGSGTGAITASAVGTNGQVLLGASAADPAFATLTSTGSTITYTAGANTLNLETGATIPVSFTTDSGSAVPALGVLSVVGTQGVETSGATSVVTVGLTANTDMTAVHGWNGSLLEQRDITATSDGATITLSIEKSGGGDLTVVFSDGFYAWDTTPADTVTLTAGSDTSPQINYVYFLQSTKTLTASTVGWPATEHAPIATALCQSAASLQTDNAYNLHSWSDDVTDSNDNGHVIDINFWIRSQHAVWETGVAPTLTITPNGGAADNVIFTSASGVILQLHEHTFPAFAGTPDIYTVNNSATPYNVVTDLNALLTDSTGASMSGRYFSLVIWGVISENTGDCKLMVNLPSGSYNSSSNVTADASKFADYSVPSDFKGAGFLIAQYNLRHQAASSGTWTEIDAINLRGFFPNLAAGSSTAAGNEFVDNVFRIVDDVDSTKKIAFQASSITTATTRTLTVQDADGIIGLSGVANYGTGVTSNTAYAVLCGGTTSTSPIQSIASVGTSGQLLTSNGAGALPTFQTAGSASISITGDSGGPLVAAAFTFTGGTTGITFAGAGTTETLTGTLVVANGGTGSTSLTQYNVLIGNNVSAITAVAPSATSGVPLISQGAAADPAFGTAVVAGGGSGRTTATAYAVICGGTTTTAAHQSVASVGTSGQVLTSNGAAALPTFQAAGGGGITWNEETGTSATMVIDNGYIANNAGLVTLTIPTTAAVGAIIRVTGKGAGGWKIAQNAGETINWDASTATTTGATGSLASSDIYDAVELVCITANTDWVILSSKGNITIV